MSDNGARASYGGPDFRETRSQPIDGFEFREVPNGTGGTDAIFTGYASVVGKPYPITDFLGTYAETIDRHAFDRTLGENADVAFLMNHEGMTLARTKSGTLKLSADDTGLHSEARMDPDNMYVKALRSAVERRDIDEMSFAFRVHKDGQTWNDDFTERVITGINLHQGDVSAVNYGANPHTGGLVGMRHAFMTRAGATLSTASMATLQRVLDMVDAADTNVDKALIVLSDLMGVTNPDIAQDAALDRTVEEEDEEIVVPRVSLDTYMARAYALRSRGQARRAS